MLFKWNKDMNWPISIFQTSDKLVQLSFFVGGVGVFVVIFFLNWSRTTAGAASHFASNLFAACILDVCCANVNALHAPHTLSSTLCTLRLQTCHVQTQSNNYTVTKTSCR